jgi:exodeoxyribonuclease V gamma subunit
VPHGDDRSIQVHACPGPVRQLEVLRDVILAALAEDPSLGESDILVVCPDLPTFAPLIPGVFGPSAEAPSPAWDGPPRIRYTISDRELRADDALAGALLSLVSLAGGRFGASEVLDFCGLAPVAAAFGFDDDALEQIEGWVGDTEIRWGLTESTRVRHDLPHVVTNTWRHGLDQLLVGLAVDDDQPVLGPGNIPAWGVEGGGVDVLNRLVALIRRLEQLEQSWNEPAPLHEWNLRLSRAVAEFFQLRFQDDWQIERVRAAIAELVVEAELSGAGSVEFSVREIAQVLEERLTASAARPRFFDGALTFTSLRPLRWVPHRMICILGLDEDAMERRTVNGDDLLAANPDLGDPDRRADQRQSLLEVVLCAGDRLVITRTGRDTRSNSEVPHSIAMAELFTEIESIVDAEDFERLVIERFHPRHGFATSNFATARPFSFDPRALAAARAKAGRVEGADAPAPIERLRSETIELADLRRVLVNAPKLFFQDRLLASFPGVGEGVNDNLPVENDALLSWTILTECINRTLRHTDVTSFVEVVGARGSLPSGRAGTDEVVALVALAGDMVERLRSLGIGEQTEPWALDVSFDPTRRIIGELDGVYPRHAIGPIRITASKEDDRQILQLWLDLCALTAVHPETPWRALVVSPKRTAKSNVKVSELRMRGETSTQRMTLATEVLARLADLHHRALREPLPILAKVGVGGTVQTPYLTRWDDLFGMQNDPYVLAAYGKLSDAELLDIGADPADPGDPGIPSRLLRLRDFLDGLRNNSVTQQELK